MSEKNKDSKNTESVTDKTVCAEEGEPELLEKEVSSAACAQNKMSACLKKYSKKANWRHAAVFTLIAVAVAGVFSYQTFGTSTGLTAQEKKALVMKELAGEDVIRTPIGADAHVAEKTVKAEEAVKEEPAATNVTNTGKKNVANESAVAKKGIAKIVPLGMNNVRAVSDESGQVMLMGENGRFVVSGGRFYDLWAKQELRSIEEIEYAAKHIPVKGFGLKSEGYNVVSLGHGKEEVFVFVDPFCGWCHRLMTEIEADSTLTERFTVHFYVVPALGDASHGVSQRLYCSGADNATKFKALKDGAKGIDALPQSQSPCDTKGYEQTLVMAQMLGVKGVPFIVASDGRFVEGKPKDVRGFLMPKAQ